MNILICLVSQEVDRSPKIHGPRLRTLLPSKSVSEKFKVSYYVSFCSFVFSRIVLNISAFGKFCNFYKCVCILGKCSLGFLKGSELRLRCLTYS